MNESDTSMETTEQAVVVDAPEAVASTPDPASAAAPAAAAPDTSTYQVMEIDLLAPPDVQAREQFEAAKLGLPIRYKNDKKAEPTPSAAAPAVVADEAKPEGGAAEELDPAAEATPTPAEEVHPVIAGLFGEVDKAAPKAPAPVREFFTKHGLGDADAVLAELPTMKRDLLDTQSKLKAAEDQLGIIAGLDPEVQNIINVAAQGGDWKNDPALKRPNFDFRVPFAKQDRMKVLNTYAADVPVTKEDLEENDNPEGDPATKARVAAAYKLAEVRYGVDANASTTAISQDVERQKQQIETYTRTRDLSLAHLQASVPGSGTYADKIKNTLTPRGVLDIFFEKDGATVKPDAAEALLYAMDRKAIMESFKKRIERQAKDGATLAQLRRTPEKNAAAALKTAAEGKPQGNLGDLTTLVRQAMGR